MRCASKITWTCISVCCLSTSVIAHAADIGWDQVVAQTKPNGEATLAVGTWEQPVAVNKPLTLRGTSLDQCILKVTSDAPALSIHSNGPVVLESVTIQWQRATSNAPSGPVCAVLIQDAPVTLRNCRIVALGNEQRCPAGLAATGFSKVNVENCRLEGFNFAIEYSGGTKARSPIPVC